MFLRAVRTNRKPDECCAHISSDCRHAAYSLEAVADLGDGLTVVEGINVWTFDGDGRIATMKAYWDPTNSHEGTKGG